MITYALDLLHILLLLTPFLIFFINSKHLKITKKYILLIVALIPSHWVFLENQCAITILSKKMGDYRNSDTTSQFSERYLKWLYLPIMNIIGWEWNSNGLDKMVTLHWVINIILIWYYVFFF